MSSAVLIQQASGRYRPLLKICARHHAAYCAKHQITYWPLIGDVQFSRTAHWNKIVLVQRALELGFETVAWLDADTLIVRDDEDIRSALNGGGPLGLAAHPMSGPHGSPFHYNSGVMIMRNTPLTRAFFDAVWQAGPLGDHHWHEQARILELLPAFPGLVQRLDDRWNATYAITEVARPVIKAWHGVGPGVIATIFFELKKLGALDATTAAIGNSLVHSGNAAWRARRFIETIPPCPGTFAGRGIVISGGGLDYFSCAWVCIHQLRRLGCTLPIQLWYLGRQELTDRMRALVAPLGVECVDAFEVYQQHPVRTLAGRELKPYSMLHCPFREVLLLDAGNVPVVNPEFIFDTPEFRAAGAVFWPDRERTPEDHESWEIFDVPYRDEPEVGSGQMAVDKARCWRALRLAMWYNEYSDFYYDYAHGENDTFRFAWHRLGQPFAMPPYPLQELESTMCQHDFSGRRIFQHRNGDQWNFHRDNQPEAGFLHEEECLADLRRLRALWDGK